MASIWDTLGLVRRESFGRATSISELSRRVENLNTELRALIASIEPHESATEVGDATLAWAYTYDHPLGPLADMGGAGADKKINPRKYIVEQIKRIKNEVENFQSSFDDSETKSIQAKWERFKILDGIAERKLEELPKIIEKFLNEIKDV